jgi:DNA-binding SARP family transcriptional activator
MGDVGEHVQVRLLGPVDITVDGVARPVYGFRRKALLAVLGVHAGEIVSVGRLLDVVWGERAASTTLNTVQSHVSYLRGLFGDRSAIAARPPGYALHLPGPATDLAAAERLVRDGRQAADPEQGAKLLRAALALWRGRPLVDVAGVAWLDAQADRLTALELSAIRALAQVRLALGEHAQLIPELERLAAQHPFDEDIHGQLMLALYRAGRQAEALAAFRQMRRVLGTELGIDPGPALRDLEAAILRQDAALDPPEHMVTVRPVVATPAPVERAAPEPLPAQLPPPMATFAGRAAELAHLDAVLAGPGATTVVISAVSGTAGVGKTALAVHWAHRAADRFPDGQLYVNLRGFDPGGSPVSPADALRDFLEALGVAPQRIPTGLDARAALYRTMVARKRVLVVLDNARDVGQVRPLLPGSVGCMAVVTSRNELTPLVVTESAYPLALDLLPRREARDLLSRRLGSRRMAAEPDAVDDIIARCARLPLALAIVGARAAYRPGLPLVALAAELRDAAGGLDALHGGDAVTEVRQVFSWSYRALSEGAARLFRQLGVHPGPDVSAPAVASLGAVAVDQARPLLAELTRANLLSEHRPGRYSFHDLLRAYAAEVGRTEDPAARQDAARQRMFDHYLHTANTATAVLYHARDPISVDAASPGTAPERHVDNGGALAWFTAEHPVLLRIVDATTAAGAHRHTWQLSWAVAPFLSRQGHLRDLLVTQQAALAAAQRLSDVVGQATAGRTLAAAYAMLGHHDEAHAHAQLALDVLGPAGDPVVRGQTHHTVGSLLERSGRHREALHHAQRALSLFQTTGHPIGATLSLVGWLHAQLHEHESAIAVCQQALVLHRAAGDRGGQANAWDTVGYAHHHLGRHDEAVGCYRQAVALFRDVGDRCSEAEALDHLGDAHRAVGDDYAAHRVWAEALGICDELALPGANGIRAKLNRRTGADVTGSPVNLIR